jgi:hypothetical protein
VGSNQANAKLKKKWVILGILLLVILLGIGKVGLSFAAASRHSGYWDVRAAEKSFKVPSDWQKVSTTKDVGWLGWGCGDALDKNGCPFIYEDYKVTSAPNGADSLVAALNDLNGITIKKTGCAVPGENNDSQQAKTVKNVCDYIYNSSDKKITIESKENSDGSARLTIGFERANN